MRRLEVRNLLTLLSASSWQQLSMSEGTKGPRLFDWICLPIWHQGHDDGWHALLIRRTIEPTPDLTYYLVFAPPDTSLQAKVSALGGRWRIEEDFENGKDQGLDHYEVRSFVGWYRHITLVMLALAFLTSIVLATKAPSTDRLPAEAVLPTDLARSRCPKRVTCLLASCFPHPAAFPWSSPGRHGGAGINDEPAFSIRAAG